MVTFPIRFASPWLVTVWVLLVTCPVLAVSDGDDDLQTSKPVVRRGGVNAGAVTGGVVHDPAEPQVLPVLPVVRRAKTTNLYPDEVSVGEASVRTTAVKIKQNYSAAGESSRGDQMLGANVTSAHEQVRRESRTHALQVNHVGELVSVRPSVAVGRRELEAALPSEVEVARDDHQVTQKMLVETVEEAIRPHHHRGRTLLLLIGLAGMGTGAAFVMNQDLRTRALARIRTALSRPQPSVMIRAASNANLTRPGQMSASQSIKHAEQERDEKAATEYTKAVATFAMATLQAWKTHGIAGKVSRRAKTLMQKLSVVTPTDYLLVNQPEKLKEIVHELGIKSELECLQRDIKAGKCQMLLMSDPESKDNEPHLIQVIRLIRVTLKAKTSQGVRILVEKERRVSKKGSIETEIQDIHRVVSRLCLDQADVQVALKSALVEKLNLTPEWQGRNLTVATIKNPEVEVKEPEGFEGFPCWYLISDAEVHLKDGADRSELEAIGLPGGTEFTTQSIKTMNTVIKVMHRWGWVRLDEAQKQSVVNDLKAPTEHSDFLCPSVKDRYEAMHNWIRQALAQWQLQKREIPQQVRAALKMILNQPMEEYNAVNSGTKVEELFTPMGVKIDAEVLSLEIQDQKCQLLYVTDPQNPGSLVTEKDKPAVLIRFARVIRVRVIAKTMWGKRCLVKKTPPEANNGKKHDNFIGTKLQLDEVNVQTSLENVLCNWLDLTRAWVESNITVTNRFDPKMEVFESKAFKGLTTWYLIEEVEVYIKDGAVEAKANTLGLPEGNDFQTVDHKAKNRLNKCYNEWTWMDEGN